MKDLTENRYSFSQKYVFTKPTVLSPRLISSKSPGDWGPVRIQQVPWFSDWFIALSVCAVMISFTATTRIPTERQVSASDLQPFSDWVKLTSKNACIHAFIGRSERSRETRGTYHLHAKPEIPLRKLNGLRHSV